MKTIFKEYLLSKAPFTERDIETLLSVAVTKEYKKGDIIFAEGKPWRYNGFVCKGITYNVTAGNVLSFVTKNQWIGDRHSLLTGQAMHYTAIALENTTIICIPQEDFEQARVTIPMFNDLIYTLIQNHLVHIRKHICSDAVLSDKERYTNFCNEKPGLEKRIPVHLLASYLKTTSESLAPIITEEQLSHRGEKNCKWPSYNSFIKTAASVNRLFFYHPLCSQRKNRTNNCISVYITKRILHKYKYSLKHYPRRKAYKHYSFFNQIHQGG